VTCRWTRSGRSASVSVYRPDGYFHKNEPYAYSVNNLSTKKQSDGSVVIRFGGDAAPPGDVNHLPIVPGWNDLVRLYRRRKEILDGTWKFREAQQVADEKRGRYTGSQFLFRGLVDSRLNSRG
jgi:hypothetical protein